MIDKKLLEEIGIDESNGIISGSSALHIYGDYPKKSNDIDIVTVLLPEHFINLGFHPVESIFGSIRYKNPAETLDIICNPDNFQRWYADSIIVDDCRYMGKRDLLDFYKELLEKKPDQKYQEAYDWLLKQMDKK